VGVEDSLEKINGIHGESDRDWREFIPLALTGRGKRDRERERERKWREVRLFPTPQEENFAVSVCARPWTLIHALTEHFPSLGLLVYFLPPLGAGALTIEPRGAQELSGVDLVAEHGEWNLAAS
jgi:hypothetical protein